MTICFTQDVPEELMTQVVAMDHEAYPPDDQITWAQARLIYSVQPDSLILLREGEELAGYLSVVRIGRELAQKALETRTPIFRLLSREHLKSDCDADIYIHNVILAPRRRGWGYSGLLREGLRQWLETRSGWRCAWGDAVSDGGRRFLTGLGLTEILTSPAIYRGEPEDVNRALR